MRTFILWAMRLRPLQRPKTRGLNTVSLVYGRAPIQIEIWRLKAYKEFHTDQFSRKSQQLNETRLKKASLRD
jgi:hypothetical protein